MQIDSIQLKNFKAYQDMYLGDIPNFAVFIGANGSGKSTLFDVLAFLKDCLTYDVAQALAQRGGFKEVISRGAAEDLISIELQCRIAGDASSLVSYRIDIGLFDNQPCVQREILSDKRHGSRDALHLIDFTMGKGLVIINEDKPSHPIHENQELDKNHVLALKGLGQFARFKTAANLRSLIENWHISDFYVNAARGVKAMTGESAHLSISGDNLQLVAKNLKDKHPEIFAGIIERMKLCVPGISQIDTEETVDGRLLLKFSDGSFKSPFMDQFVSDGTLKMFAYLVLLHDPKPHSFLCVEEPENQLYPSLLSYLVDEFRDYAQRGGQVFVSTHSPDFLNATTVDEVFWLEKNVGLSLIHRAKEDAQLCAYMAEGDQMGYLWSHGLFGKVHPW